MSAGDTSSAIVMKAFKTLKLWKRCAQAYAVDLLQSEGLSGKDRDRFRSNLKVLIGGQSGNSDESSSLPESPDAFLEQTCKPGVFATDEQRGLAETNIAKYWLIFSLHLDELIRLRDLALGTGFGPSSLSVLQRIGDCRADISRFLNSRGLNFSLREVFRSIDGTLQDAEGALNTQVSSLQSSNVDLRQKGEWLLDTQHVVFASSVPLLIDSLRSLWAAQGSNRQVLQSLAGLPDLQPAPPLFSAVLRLAVAVVCCNPSGKIHCPAIFSKVFNSWLEFASHPERDIWLLNAIHCVYNALTRDTHLVPDKDQRLLYCEALKELLRIGGKDIVPVVNFDHLGLPQLSTELLTEADITLSPIDSSQSAAKFSLNFQRRNAARPSASPPVIEISLPTTTFRNVNEQWGILRNLNHAPLNAQFVKCCLQSVTKDCDLPRPDEWFLRAKITAEDVGLSSLVERLRLRRMTPDTFREFLQICRVEVFPHLDLQTGAAVVPSNLSDYPHVTVEQASDLNTAKDEVRDVRFAFSRLDASFVVVRAPDASFRQAALAFDCCSDPHLAHTLLLQLLRGESGLDADGRHQAVQSLASLLVSSVADQVPVGSLDLALQSLRALARRFTPSLVVYPEVFRFGGRQRLHDFQGTNLQCTYEYSTREKGTILSIQDLVVGFAGTLPPSVHVFVSAGPPTTGFESARTSLAQLPAQVNQKNLSRLLDSLPERETTERSRGYDVYREIYRQLWPERLTADEVEELEKDKSLVNLRDWFTTAVRERNLFRVTFAQKGDKLRDPWRKGETFTPENDNYRATVVKCMLRPLLQEFHIDRTIEEARFYVDES